MASSTTQPRRTSSFLPVENAKGFNGLDKVILREVRGSSAEIYLYGGHVTSWKNDHGEELLFVSSKGCLATLCPLHKIFFQKGSSDGDKAKSSSGTEGCLPTFGEIAKILGKKESSNGDRTESSSLTEAVFKPPKPIRGGIPICFPQFSNHGPLEAHGFARNRLWSVDPDPPPSNTSNRAYVDLLLKPTDEDMKIWAHSFEFRLRVALGHVGDLMLTSRIRNTDSKPFTFTFAYHTYFSVSDISEVRVEGLETLDYLDNLSNKERFTEQGDAITFEGEVDKIYLSTPTKIAILDHERKRTFVIRKDGLPDAVVWNPWDKKAKAMADFGDDEYKHMLCVEAAAIEKPIMLKPGEEWRGRQEICAVPSSYCSGLLDPAKVLGS